MCEKGTETGRVPTLAQDWGNTENPRQHVSPWHLQEKVAWYTKYGEEEWGGGMVLNKNTNGFI